ncbi:hypothetical protein BDP27DRAFT_1333888, partial [Rhodocollybia butyracea]
MSVTEFDVAAQEVALGEEVLFSPSRRSDSNQLSSIPAEIYLEIIGYIKPIENEPFPRSFTAKAKQLKQRRNDLRSLSCVCRFLRILTIPILFESMEFIVRSVENDTSFFASLSRNEDLAVALALHVNELHIAPGKPAVRESADLVSSYSAAFSWLPHLRRLQIWKTPLVSILLSSPSITSLILRAVDFNAITSDMVHQAASQLKLQTFELYGQAPEDPSVTAAFLPLVTNVTELRTDMWIFMENIISSGIIPPLEILDVRVAKPDLFFCFLYQLAALKSLTFTSDIDEVSISEHMLSLPRLHSLRQLTCPPRSITWLHGEHNLSSLSFSWYFHPSELRSSLPPSTPSLWTRIDHYRSLSELEIPYLFAIDIKPDPRRHLTRLKKLSLIFIMNLRIDETDTLYNHIAKLSTIWGSDSLRELHWQFIGFSHRHVMSETDSIPAYCTKKEHFRALFGCRSLGPRDSELMFMISGEVRRGYGSEWMRITWGI